MSTQDKVRKTIKDLFAQISLSGSELAQRLQWSADIEYWRSLCPELKIGELKADPPIEKASALSEQEVLAVAHLRKHGYFQMLPVSMPCVYDRMYKAVEIVRAAGWPAIFSFVYDEFWAIHRTQSISRVLGQFFGDDYLQTADIWVHRVDPRIRGRGFRPHHDGRGDTNHLTIWVPLTDVSVQNGCMYVIPQDRLPKSLPDHFAYWESVSQKDMKEILHNVIALPTPRGTVLGWNHRLLHWGGQTTDPTATPRISISVGFIKSGMPPKPFELPLLGRDLPIFSVRLCAIGKAIAGYTERDPAMKKYLLLAEKMMQQYGEDH